MGGGNADARLQDQMFSPDIQSRRIIAAENEKSRPAAAAHQQNQLDNSYSLATFKQQQRQHQNTSARHQASRQRMQRLITQFTKPNYGLQSRQEMPLKLYLGSKINNNNQNKDKDAKGNERRAHHTDL